MNAANPSHALALVVVDELARHGCTDAVLAPGSRSTALAMALHDDPRIRLHVQIDERSAAFVAIGLARVLRRPTAVVSTSGSAVANLHPAVIEADTGGVPLLLLTADRPPELRGTGSNQTIDQLGIFGRSVRWFHEVGVPEDRPGIVGYWRSVVSQAVARTRGLGTGPGPVHLNLAFREPTVPLTDDGRSSVPHAFAQPLSGRPNQRPWSAVRAVTTAVSRQDLAGLAERIAGTERGLVLVGGTSQPVAQALDLARHAGWPVIAEPHSGVRSGTQVITAAHHLASNEAFARSHTPDLVLQLGRPGLSRAVTGLLGVGVPHILLSPHGSWDDPTRTVSELLVGDPALVCEALARLLSAPASSEWLDGWQRADAAARAAVDDALDVADALTEPAVARDVAAATPDGGILVVASSMPIRDLDLVMAPREHLRIVANRGASGIDGTISTVLGAALAEAGPVTALAGDLALLHDSNGFLLSPAADRLDAVIVVIDNDGGGIFHFLPQVEHQGSFERVFGTPHGRDLGQLAAFHGLGYHRPERPAELAVTLERARQEGGIQLVHVRTDRQENVAVHRRMQAAVDKALHAIARP